MADDIAGAMVATMDDDELTAHVRELRDWLGAIPQGDERRGPLLTAFGRACSELNSRGLPYEYGQWAGTAPPAAAGGDRRLRVSECLPGHDGVPAVRPAAQDHDVRRDDARGNGRQGG